MIEKMILTVFICFSLIIAMFSIIRNLDRIEDENRCRLGDEEYEKICKFLGKEVDSNENEDTI